MRIRPSDKRVTIGWTFLKAGIPYVLLLVVGLCLLVGIWSLVHTRTADRSAEAIARASERAETIAISFEQLVARTLDAAENVILIVAASTKSDGVVEATKLLSQSDIFDGTLFHSVDVLDWKASLIASTIESTSDVNYPQRDYLNYALRHETSGLVIGRPTAAQFWDGALIPVARRVTPADGSTGLLIVVWVKAESLLTHSTDFRRHDRTLISLIGTDGALRVTDRPVNESRADVMDPAIIKARQAISVHGAHLERSSDGKKSFYVAYKTLSRYPLIATASVDFSQFAEELARSREEYILWARKSSWLVSLSIIMLGFFLLRRDRANHILRRNEIILHKLARLDPLTNLPNRTAFDEIQSTELRRADVIGYELACLLLDLDGLGQINATRGFSAGDEVIKAVGQILSPMMDTIGCVARIGGDEFVAIFRIAGQGETHALLIAEEMRSAIEAPRFIQGRPMTLKASIGVSLYPKHARCFADLLRCADAAMACSKLERQGLPYVFKPEMHISIARRLSMRAEFAKAIEEKQLVLFYQPKVDLINRRPVGMEALVRWRHPTRGLISPEEFLPLAEETGLILPMGAWVLEQACIDCQILMHSGVSDFTVGVNISALQFSQPDFSGDVRRALRRVGLPARWLTLEITEEVLFDQREIVVKRLNQLKRLGLKLALDNFGTGFSNLQNLRRYPFDTIQIDRTFVAGLPADTHSRSLVLAIVGLARTLNLAVLAEGIETSAQHQFLLSNHCGAGQGFLYGKPMPFVEFQGWLRKLVQMNDKVVAFPRTR